ncbi:MAG TPA: response regulator [Nitrospirae bacterium]|nr:response regulator [Nitrospirota bacterium]
MKILIIDDSLLARIAVKKCLIELKDLSIYEASDGVEGLSKFKDINPDIVFLDLTMPVMDGFVTLQEIKKLNEKVNVIVLTADIQTKTAEKVMNLGATMVLKKPPIKNEILQALDLIKEQLQKR